MAGQADSLKSILFALFANSAIALAKDIAALFGLLFALLAIVATFLTGNPLWDAVGTIAIGALLIGQSVEPVQREAIRQFITARPEVRQVFSLITLQLGNDIMVAVQAEMADPEASTASNITRINATEAALKLAFPEIRWSFFEPDDSP